MPGAQPLLKVAKSQPAGVDYTILRGAEAVGDATDIYGFALTSPFINPKNKN